MSFNYNDVLKIANMKSDKTTKYNETEIVEKYRKGEVRIVTEQARYPLANLKNIFDSYNLNPDYQRRRVWDNKRKSRLIESFIINVPIPPIFLYEYDFSRYEVMDGLQRVTSILEFFDNKFALEGLDLWGELNEKYFSDLPNELKLAIERRYLSAIILLKETANDEQQEKLMKRFVFERLNTGGIELSPQEIRNAMYSCDFNERLIKMAESEIFRTLWGELESENYSRMEDCELVLRFFAYKSACKYNLAKNTFAILDVYAEKARDFTEENIIVLEKLFNSTLNIVNFLFGETAFKSSGSSKKSEKMIYDTVMLSCAELMEEGLEAKLLQLNPTTMITEKFKCISKNSDVFNGKYTSIRNVKERVAILKKLLRGNTNEL
ncbi:hypothetical protein C162_20376 [Paenibacillus sp. FSL R7-269]|uniref:DUF262 domain-containing protein n=1 Tax=Paenibacillus sp. FSL R7-269 TaxID=1226755 RepID=UPI0003E1EC68|nr:DUF262 domain-containing protein [Paenibacillus sp. FSL R7-269]ETT45727.1 hypothetical protein C162_20376 [Paenibacillus sp. FSL R7-269]